MVICGSRPRPLDSFLRLRLFSAFRAPSMVKGARFLLEEVVDAASDVVTKFELDFVFENSFSFPFVVVASIFLLSSASFCAAFRFGSVSSPSELSGDEDEDDEDMLGDVSLHRLMLL